MKLDNNLYLFKNYYNKIYFINLLFYLDNYGFHKKDKIRETQ